MNLTSSGTEVFWLMRNLNMFVYYAYYKAHTEDIPINNALHMIFKESEEI